METSSLQCFMMNLLHGNNELLTIKQDDAKLMPCQRARQHESSRRQSWPSNVPKRGSWPAHISALSSDNSNNDAPRIPSRLADPLEEIIRSLAVNQFDICCKQQYFKNQPRLLENGRDVSPMNEEGTRWERSRAKMHKNARWSSTGIGMHYDIFSAPKRPSRCPV